ncbi:hypothetical protein AUJ66_00305 [Candidatus Desantisbacteria bacterium CG1_02_38_46]|uniref:Uncharacterized protein n=3 Tax=unclassified Candidatus Desantisiibacteriota TaxID=3106372 RepID=A0A2H9PC14_9BACT|nr:MAG: hypothetical protein AUJ66_00305 [Candidatus Desantisbacteria bacterium CG1_02_38_46]PIU50973.1 MAG: hypothetical protein COS91_06860 [Candidatus Desantisbacteria bacterium CG07_land_8_20_14_0_80_39_15]PIZ16587.1 MAG: hypothetical protein COY51_02420 [Candidatus Desantisbacteria bacterium CG_4_10_14_0_8_um_filter_39_17]
MDEVLIVTNTQKVLDFLVQNPGKQFLAKEIQMIKKLIFILISVVVFSTSAFAAETFRLKDGTIISGNIISVTEDTITIKTKEDMVDINRSDILILSKEFENLLNVAGNIDKWSDVWERIDAVRKISELGDTTVIPYLIKIQTQIPMLRDEIIVAIEKISSRYKVSTPKIEKEVLLRRVTIIETEPIKAINNILLFKMERRDPAIACLLSMATFGGGQIYNYQPHKAVIAYLISGVSLLATFSNNQFGILLGAIGLFGTGVWSAFDSYNSAVDINEELEYKYKIGVKFRY